MYNELEFTTDAAPLLPETVANNKTIKEYAKYQMNNLLLYKFVSSRDLSLITKSLQFIEK